MQDWNEHSGQIIVGCSGVCAGIGGIYLLENGGESKSTSPEIILKSRLAVHIFEHLYFFL